MRPVVSILPQEKAERCFLLEGIVLGNIIATVHNILMLWPQRCVGSYLYLALKETERLKNSLRQSYQPPNSRLPLSTNAIIEANELPPPVRRSEPEERGRRAASQAMM